MLVAVPRQVWLLTEIRSVVQEIGANFIGNKNGPITKSSPRISYKKRKKGKSTGEDL